MALVTTLPDTVKRTASRRQAPSLSLTDTLRLWRRRARERAELARFTDRELHDIGIGASDALHEINKPVWRA
ncbi:DUF1127 domain-containing protein [Vineibacter terrae]|uniref:DUF1127 domain-containing protein n=1 Tax=Vineibacter terrae TaxID=2586908 RepID=UPI002E314126|nr:DUF1127 domain-containing protein [Vineibacter terrae]HEX2890032.1 DUF1127 domain-containing protein [Vineibacter terrae]